MASNARHGFETQQNFLLRAFPDDKRRRWEAHLESISLAGGTVLYAQAELPSHLYFPCSAVISLQCVMRSGALAEIAVVGREGMLGTSLLSASGRGEAGRAVVQVAGDAYRLNARELRNGLKPDGAVFDVLLGYSNSLLAQVAQTAACNRYHSIEQQFCRRLLMAQDRSGSTELAMTHEQTAGLLGVRREGVSVAAMKLQRAGLIRYSRGRIFVRDRRRLEQRACECYALAKQEYGRLLPDPPGDRHRLAVVAAPAEPPPDASNRSYG